MAVRRSAELAVECGDAGECHTWIIDRLDRLETWDVHGMHDDLEEMDE